VPSTPGTISITSSAQPLEIACRAPGLTSKPVPLRARSLVDERGTAGAVTGGVVAGVGTGIAAGAALGAMLTPLAPLVLMIVAGSAGTGAAMGTVFDEGARDVRYPETIAVPLVCPPEAPLEPEIAAAPVGIVIRGLTNAEATAAGLSGPEGVIVTRLAADSRAARAGLRERDIVVRCGDTDIADPAQLQAVVRAAPPDRPIRLVVWRDGQPVEISLPQRVPTP
jgi:membrane-associated protease RseP (regulator of RpoE activity)